MKIFLDDERTTPEGWVRAYWPSEVIALLERGGVTEVSLDHDLGDDQRGTGYDVILDRGSCSNKGVQAAHDSGPLSKQLGKNQNGTRH